MIDDHFDKKRKHYNQQVSDHEQTYFEADKEYHSALVARDIVIERMQSRLAEEQRILDIGCGNGGMVIPLLEKGYDVDGFDLSDKMVESGRSYLSDNGYNEERIREGNFAKGVPFDGTYDGIVSIGLFEHFESVKPHLERVAGLLEEDGVAVIQFRNALLSLFSYNEYTYKFIWGRLLDESSVPDELKAEFEERIRDICNIEGDIERTVAEDSEGTFSNPLTISDMFHSAGFTVDDIHFYNYHPLPPEFEETAPDAYDELAQQYEDPDDWRGYLLASSFIVEATPT